jgi:hypothetical protein
MRAMADGYRRAGPIAGVQARCKGNEDERGSLRAGIIRRHLISFLASAFCSDTWLKNSRMRCRLSPVHMPILRADGLKDDDSVWNSYQPLYVKTRSSRRPLKFYIKGDPGLSIALFI